MYRYTFVLAPLLATNSSLQVWHFVYLISSAITKNYQTGFSLGLCAMTTEADDSVAIDSVELRSNDESTEESIQDKETYIIYIMPLN